jgi:hypothetical protein
MANNDTNNLGNVRTAYLWRVCALLFTYLKRRDTANKQKKVNVSKTLNKTTHYRTS